MENQTRNNILVFCALALTVTACYVLISNEIDKKRAINAVNNFVNETGNALSGVSSNSLNSHNKIIQKQSKKINQLISEKRNLQHQLTALQTRFATQIEAEKNKAKIKWSDGTSKPKYNQVQEGIGWSK